MHMITHTHSAKTSVHKQDKVKKDNTTKCIQCVGDVVYGLNVYNN